MWPFTMCYCECASKKQTRCAWKESSALFLDHHIRVVSCMSCVHTHRWHTDIMHDLNHLVSRDTDGRFCRLGMNAAELAVAPPLNSEQENEVLATKSVWGSRHISPRTHTTQQIKGPRGRVWWGNHTGFQSIVVLHLTRPPRPTIEILIHPPVS